VAGELLEVLDFTVRALGVRGVARSVQRQWFWSGISIKRGRGIAQVIGRERQRDGWMEGGMEGDREIGRERGRGRGRRMISQWVANFK
jgi:hypothetical protein